MRRQEKRNFPFFIAIMVAVVALQSAYLLFQIFGTSKNTEYFVAQAAKEISQPSKLTLERIFADDHSFVDSLPEDRKRTVIATGDVLLARIVNVKTVRSRNFSWPFEKAADFLRSADVTFINLETPLIKQCPLTTEGMRFCGDPRNVEGLLFAGVDVVNLANNHIGNYGESGISNTVSVLERMNILPSGIQGPVYKDIRGMRFAFLGYNDVEISQSLSDAEPEKIGGEVAEARQHADIVIVQFHWGTEYTTQITKRQRELAHLAVDNGADLIIGNHPHWIQPIEVYKEKLITYSHGNFVFDQMWSQKTREGIIGKYTFFDKMLVAVEFLPVYIENYGQPDSIADPKKQQILNAIQVESKE